MVSSEHLVWVGLLFDLVGFILIGRFLWKPSNQRPFYGDSKGLDRLGFALVIFGFFLQMTGQVLNSMLGS